VSSPRSLNPRDLTSGAGADTFSVEAPSATGCRGESEAPTAGAAGVGGGETTFSSAGSAMALEVKQDARRSEPFPFVDLKSALCVCVCVFFSYALAAFFFLGRKRYSENWMDISRRLEYGAKVTSVTTCRRSSSSTCYVSTKRFVSLVSTRKRQTSESPEVIYIFSISIIFSKKYFIDILFFYILCIHHFILCWSKTSVKMYFTLDSCDTLKQISFKLRQHTTILNIYPNFISNREREKIVLHKCTCKGSILLKTLKIYLLRHKYMC
jgi:hypothetical protein